MADMQRTIENTAGTSSHDIQMWFNELIHAIQVDKLSFETKTISADKESFYNTLRAGSPLEIGHEVRKSSSKLFIETIMYDYIKELGLNKKKPLKLAFDLSDSKVLVWAEIADDDESMEDNLIIAEAKVNAKYGQYGFHVSSTIVEDSDKLKVPPHYQSII